ncbi:hypothetical protein JXA88_03865 [Candidatus Fermentibacteria bacterium]|nr:hypothetical protein [Candidatus Fermentibacteria bacterium]
MTSLDNARNLILTSVSPVEPERIALLDAGGRVASEDILAPVPLPPVRIAAVEGFLCREDDMAPHGILMESPVDPAVEPLAVSPGDIVPPDAAAIVRAPGSYPAGEGEGIVEAGMLATSDEVIIPRGTNLSAMDVRLLAELGTRRVPVHRKPRIAVVAIGDELARLDDTLGPGKRYDGASPMLAAYVGACGGIPVQLGPVPRNPEDIEFAMSKAFDEDDALILVAASGAVHSDDLAQILAKKGVDQRFLGVALHPGCASFFGMARGMPVLLVSSAAADLLVTSELLIAPLVQKLTGVPVGEPRKVGAMMEQTLRGTAGVCAVWAIELKTEGRALIARPVKGWPGGVVFSAASVHGLCISSDGRDVRAGYSAEVIPVRAGFR